MGSRIGVVGTGYVGLTTGACLAHLGHEVVCFDTDLPKIERLRRGIVPIREPGLDELVAEGLASGRLAMCDEPARAWDREFTFLCLPTPSAPDGTADLGALRAACAAVGPHLPGGSVVVAKSTVPVGSLADVRRWLGRTDVAVAANPEFLREGSAVGDWLAPDRVVVGADDVDVAERVAALYDGIDRPLVLTDPRSAQLAKYGANALLATRLSFVNGLAALCRAVDADPAAVLEAMALDARIGGHHLEPGPGWGGSCFPKDLDALRALARELDVPFGLLDEAAAMNRARIEAVADGVLACLAGPSHRPTVAVWGLTFKAGTDDLRDSPAVGVIAHFRRHDVYVRAHDPMVPPGSHIVDAGVEVVDDPYEACAGAGALAVLTGWPDYRDVDLERVAACLGHGAVIDTRGVIDRTAVERAGLVWRPV